MKGYLFIGALLVAMNIYASEAGKYDAGMNFLMKVIEDESSGVKEIRSPSRCTIEISTEQKFGAMRVTNLRTYYIGNIKKLSIRNTLDVGKGPNDAGQKILAKSYPYSLQFDGGFKDVVMKSLVIMENLQFPQFNKPPEINEWTESYFMFQNKAEADRAIPVIKGLIKVCQ